MKIRLGRTEARTLWGLLGLIAMLGVLGLYVWTFYELPAMAQSSPATIEVRTNNVVVGRRIGIDFVAGPSARVRGTNNATTGRIQVWIDTETNITATATNAQPFNNANPTNETIRSDADNKVPLRVIGFPGAVTNVQEWNDSGGTRIGQVETNGWRLFKPLTLGQAATVTNAAPLYQQAEATFTHKVRWPDTLQTIAGGVITANRGWHRVDTEGAGASDDLDTITATGADDGQIVILSPADDARTVVIKHNTGNISCVGNADLTLDDVHDLCILIYQETGDQWYAMSDTVGVGGGGSIDARLNTLWVTNATAFLGPVGFKEPAAFTNTTLFKDTVTFEQSSSFRQGFTVTEGESTLFGNLKLTGVLILPPKTNANAWVVTVTTNSVQVNPTATNGTVTFTGTPDSGVRIEYWLHNLAATNFDIGIPSAKSEDQDGNPAVTTFPCRSNSVTKIWFTFKSGEWWVTGKGATFVESYSAISAGQVDGWHDKNTKTNLTLASVNADEVKVNETAVTASVSFTNTPPSPTQAPVTWSLTAGTDPDPDKASLVVGPASGGQAGVVTAQDQTFGGAKTFTNLVDILFPVIGGTHLSVRNQHPNGEPQVQLQPGTGGSWFFKALTNNNLRIESTVANPDGGVEVIPHVVPAEFVTYWAGRFQATNFVAHGATNEPGSMSLADTNHTLTVKITTGPVLASNLVFRVPTNGPSGNNTNLSAVVLADGTFQWIWVSDNATAGGEANTSSNQGTGVGIASAKSGVDLPFKSFKSSANSALTWTTNATEITPAVTRVGVWRTVWIPAGAMRPSTTNGATAVTVNVAGGTDYVTDDAFEFDDTTEQSVEFDWVCRQWDRGNIHAEVYWYSTNTIGTNIYAIKAKSVADDESTSGSWGTAFQNTAASGATSTTANRLNKTAVIASITVGGSPAEAEVAYFHLARKPGDASDNLVGKSRMKGVLIHYQESATELAAP